MKGVVNKLRNSLKTCSLEINFKVEKNNIFFLFPGIQNIISLGVFTRRRWGDVIYVISSLKHFDDFLITKLNDFVNYKIYLYSNALLNHLSQVFSGLMTSQGITLHLFQGV